MTCKCKCVTIVASSSGTHRKSLPKPKQVRRQFFISKIIKEVDHMQNTPQLKNRLPLYYWIFIAICIAILLSLEPAFASSSSGTIWAKFSEIMKDVYGKLVGISTIVAVTASAVALIVRMVSRNQRAVDEATSWLKRIIVTWFILNTLGFFVAYIQPWIAGGQYTGP